MKPNLDGSESKIDALSELLFTIFIVLTFVSLKHIKLLNKELRESE